MKSLFGSGSNENGSIVQRCNIELISYEVFFFQGGLGTEQEMCLSFHVYYPKQNLTRCLSSYSPAWQMFYKTYVE